MSANGLIYLNSYFSGSLYAIEMNTGSIRWTTQAPDTILLDHDLLYITDANYTMKALDASTGTQLWQKDGRNGSHFSTVFAATDHLAYITRDDGLLQAVNGRDGTVLWQHMLKVDPSGSLTDGPAALQVTSEVVYLSTRNSSVYAFRERDGALLWQFKTTQGYSLNRLTSSAFGDGMIFLSADQTYALRMSDGKLLWRAARKGRLLEANGLLYLNAFHSFGSANPTSSRGVFDSVIALRATDGKQAWQKPFAPSNPGERPTDYTMLLLEHGLYIFPSADYGSAAHLFALSASDGKQEWEHTLSGVKFSLAALQGTLYLVSDDNNFRGPGRLEALSETDGTVLWSRSLPEMEMLVTNDAIYAGIGGNTGQCAPVSSAQVEKLQLSDASPTWHRQLDPAPDPLLFTKRVLAILGGLLALLGLLFFFVLRKGRPKGQRPSPLA
ncbi:MAG: outer membrane protein assembly factor BamB family protein [Ktedonobacterales bacterium]